MGKTEYLILSAVKSTTETGFEVVLTLPVGTVTVKFNSESEASADALLEAKHIVL